MSDICTIPSTQRRGHYALYSSYRSNVRKADFKTRLKKDDCTVILTSVVIVTTLLEERSDLGELWRYFQVAIVQLHDCCLSFKGRHFRLIWSFHLEATQRTKWESHTKTRSLMTVGKSRLDASCFSKLRPSLNFSPCHFYVSFSSRASCCHYCCCIFVSYFVD